jgi:hypothetical protein
MDNHFTLTIHTRTGHFGSTASSERAGIAYFLHQAAQQIASGAPATPLLDRGHVIGDYKFGSGMINGPGPDFDRTNIDVKPASEGGKIRVCPVAPEAAPHEAA